MGKRTSVYLDDELYERWQKSGIPLAELVRRGLDKSPQYSDTDLMRRALVMFGRVVDRMEERQRERSGA